MKTVTVTKTNKPFWILNISGWFVYLFFGGVFFSMMQGGLNLNTLYMQSLSFVLMVSGC